MKDRFWSKVNKTKDCWEWIGSLTTCGYGQFKLYDHGNGNQLVKRAHQVAWYLEKGEWPPYLCHKCDNPKCVRISHLFEGNQKINSRDMSQKGRAPMAGAKLTNDIVSEIRHAYASGISSDKLSLKYKVPKSTIISLLNGKTWKRAPGPIRDRGVRYWSNKYASGKTGGNKNKH